MQGNSKIAKRVALQWMRRVTQKRASRRSDAMNTLDIYMRQMQPKQAIKELVSAADKRTVFETLEILDREYPGLGVELPDNLSLRHDKMDAVFAFLDAGMRPQVLLKELLQGLPVRVLEDAADWFERMWG